MIIGNVSSWMFGVYKVTAFTKLSNRITYNYVVNLLLVVHSVNSSPW